LPEVRTSEQLLIDHIGNPRKERVLCNTLGRAQYACAYSKAQPAAEITCCFFDQYHFLQTPLVQELPTNVHLLCQSDFPKQEFDRVALATKQHGEAEMTRELLQNAHQRLKLEGQLVVSTDNPSDRWLRDQLTPLFSKVNQRDDESGVVYSAIKRELLRKVKSFDCEFVFRDQERLLKLWSRPGVFSHRRVDAGARALVGSMEIPAGSHVLDIGCGAGTISVAAAVRAEGVTVTSIDSNPRAVEATQASARLNDIETINARLDCDGSSLEEGSFDVVVANPPYYSHHQISELFVKIAKRALKPGGKIFLVTKDPEWYDERMPWDFTRVHINPVKKYWVVQAQA